MNEEGETNVSFQKVVILGQVGSAPKIDWNTDGNPMTRFTVATNRRWRDRTTGHLMEDTTWFRVLATGRLAESCYNQLQPGRGIYLEGPLKPDPATGGPRILQTDDGPRAAFEIVALFALFLPERQPVMDAPPDPEGLAANGGLEPCDSQ